VGPCFDSRSLQDELVRLDRSSSRNSRPDEWESERSAELSKQQARHAYSHWRTGFQALHRSAWNGGYEIINKADGPTQIDLYDEISPFGIDARAFVKELRDVRGPVDLHLNSPGGNIFDGIAIYNALKQRKEPLAITVDGLAASAASFIAMAADEGELAMAPHSALMIHDGWGMCVGNAADMVKLAEDLDRASDNIASIYAERSGKEVAHWRDLMREETWFDDYEAVDAGLADRVLGQAPKPAKSKGPVNSKKHLQNAAVDETPWDGNAVYAAGSASSNPEAFFRAVCAGEKTVGNPDTQAHWALPHHKEPGAPPNRKGVSSALGYLPATHDLRDPAAARAHLEAHERAMGNPSQGHAESELAAMATALRKVD